MTARHKKTRTGMTARQKHMVKIATAAAPLSAVFMVAGAEAASAAVLSPSAPAASRQYSKPGSDGNSQPKNPTAGDALISLGSGLAAAGNIPSPASPYLKGGGYGLQGAGYAANYGPRAHGAILAGIGDGGIQGGWPGPTPVNFNRDEALKYWKEHDPHDKQPGSGSSAPPASNDEYETLPTWPVPITRKKHEAADQALAPDDGVGQSASGLAQQSQQQTGWDQNQQQTGWDQNQQAADAGYDSSGAGW